MPTNSPSGDSTVNEALFQRAVHVTIQNEGGDAVTSDATGGLTKYGWALNENPGLTRDAILNMTEAQAIDRYRDKFWTPYRWAELPDAVAVKAFDIAVNAGPFSSVQCLQRALRACGKRVLDDGALGTLTVTAAFDVPADALLAALKSEVAGHYRMVGVSKPQLSGAITGLLNRAYA